MIMLFYTLCIALVCSTGHSWCLRQFLQAFMNKAWCNGEELCIVVT